MPKKVIFALLALFIFNPLQAQESSRKNSKIRKIDLESPLLARKLIDSPTANMLPRGSFDFDLRVYPQGGLFGAVDIGLANRFMLGVSYGASNLFGEGGVNWNKRVEFMAKYKVLKESYGLPAISIGFDTQGAGAFDDSLRRYTIKSKGFYAVLSKGYLSGTTPLDFHIGANYSLENKDGDKSPSFFAGIELRFRHDLAWVLEYDVGLNDNKSSSPYGKGRGYLNTGFRWIFSDMLNLEIDLKNLLVNRKNAQSFSRELRIIYLEYF